MSPRVLTLAGLPLISFALAALSLPLMKRIAGRCGVIAVPQNDSRHRAPTPLLGGGSIIGAILVPLALIHALPFWMLAGVLGLFVIGLVDDALVLRPLTKFVAQVAVVLFVVAAAPRLDLALWPWLNDALAYFFLLSTINAFNLIDGLDGLAGGVGIAAAVAVTAIALLQGETAAALCGLAIAGALAGFLLYNLHPASIFMGDCGALPLGLLLGFVSLHVGGIAAGNSRLSRYVVPILIMLVPLLDTAIVCISRMATERPVSRRGLDHSHHRLLFLGLSDKRAVVVCWSVASAAGLCAIALTVMQHAYLLVTLPFIVLAFALIGLFMIDLTFDANPPGVAYGRLQGGLARFIVEFSYKRRLAEAALDLALIPAAYFGAFLIRLDFAIDNNLMGALLGSLPWVIGATYAAFLAAGVYRGIWRYASMSDVLRFANGAILAGILLVVVSLGVPFELSGSIAVLFVILLFNLLVASRLSFRALRKGLNLLASFDGRVLVVGAGELAEVAARYITGVHGRRLKLVGFVDDDSFKLGKLVHGALVLGSLDELERVYPDTCFDQIVIATQLTSERMALVRAFANRHDLTTRRFSMDVNEMGLPEPLNSQQRASTVVAPVSAKVVA